MPSMPVLGVGEETSDNSGWDCIHGPGREKLSEDGTARSKLALPLSPYDCALRISFDSHAGTASGAGPALPFCG